jgi:hypothetical protein
MMGDGLSALDMQEENMQTPKQLAKSFRNYSVTDALKLPFNAGQYPMTVNMKIALGIITSLSFASLCVNWIVNSPFFMWPLFIIPESVIFYSIWKAAHTDPGFIHVDRDLSTSPLRLSRGELARYSSSSDHFPICYTCNTRRVMRSKHCSVMNRCVARFDHFCPWISNDVGLGNQHYFFLFLCSVTITTAMALMYFTWFVWWYDPAPHWVMAIYARPQFFAAFVLDLLVFMSVGSLFGSFVYYSMVNLSTNETMNWKKYKHFNDPESGLFVNPFDRGNIWENMREYLGLEKLPSGGYGRRINWRSCFDMTSYLQFRQSLVGETTGKGGKSDDDEDALELGL